MRFYVLVLVSVMLLHSLNAQSIVSQWSVTLTSTPNFGPKNGTLGTVTTYGDALIIPGTPNTTALDSSTGEILWETSEKIYAGDDWLMTYSPDELQIVGRDLYSLSPIWKRTMNHGSRFVTASGTGFPLIWYTERLTNYSYLIQINPYDGTTVWNVYVGEWTLQISTKVAVVLCKSGCQYIKAIDANTGEQIWNGTNMEYVVPGEYYYPFFDDNTVYAYNTNDDYTYYYWALDLKSGNIRWKQTINLPTLSPDLCSISGNTAGMGIATYGLYWNKFGSSGRYITIYAFDSEDGTPLWNSTTTNTGSNVQCFTPFGLLVTDSITHSLEMWYSTNGTAFFVSPDSPFTSGCDPSGTLFYGVSEQVVSAYQVPENGS